MVRPSRHTLPALTSDLSVDAETHGQHVLAQVASFFEDDIPVLVRSRQGRRLSRFRYRNAEGFFLGITGKHNYGRDDLFYRAGIVAQLGLSAHLLNVGFDDDWCARRIGLRVSKSLAYANATRFGHDCEDMARLAAVLSPYSRWNNFRLIEKIKPDADGFTVEQVIPLLRQLLDRVQQVTRHAQRPDNAFLAKA